jgi:hypothetical protein
MSGVSRHLRIVAFAAAIAVLASAKLLHAQTAEVPAPKQESPAETPSPLQTPENCPGLVARDRRRVIPAAFDVAALNADQVRITFVGHATFLIESPQLVRIATDYNDYVRPPILPDIITMNHAHDTHYTDHPDPAIKYVLRGWSDTPNQPAQWDLTYRDVRVRNVPTNIRDFEGGTERYGNFRNRQSVHRSSEPPAPHADTTAAQRDRPRRRGHGASRRLLYARSRRHHGRADRDEAADHHPDALFRAVRSRALSRPRAQIMGRADGGSTLDCHLKDDAAEEP